MKFSDWKAVLAEEVSVRGLPKEIGARGWIAEMQEFMHDGRMVATATDGLKGWLYVGRDHNPYDDEPSYTNIDTVYRVIEEFVGNNCQDDTCFYLEDEDRYIELTNDEADGKSWEYNSLIGEEELWNLVRENMADELDEDDDPDSEPDGWVIQSFFWDHCENVGGEVEFSLAYSAAWVEFDDGFKIGYTSDRDGNVRIMRYGDIDVTEDGSEFVPGQPSAETQETWAELDALEAEMDKDDGVVDEAASKAPWPFPSADRP